MPSSAPVILIGFMGTGKTTVGRELARRRGLPFVDLDDVIEADAGMSVKDVFAAEGEAGFRRREAEALACALAREVAVVATGGGAPCAPGAIEAMREAGVVVALAASFEEIERRIGLGDDRPLWLAPPPVRAGASGGAAVGTSMRVERLQQLLDARTAHYRQAHFSIDTDRRDVEEVTDAVERGVDLLTDAPARARTASVVVELGERSYPVVVADGAISDLGRLCRRHLGADCASLGLISDTNVAPHYARPVAEELRRAGFVVHEAVVPAGEESKSLAQLGRVADLLVRAGLDRRSAIVALGGGVVGDLAGLVAATLFRGVQVVQVPTTLVAMTDSALGGKAGVDLDAGKNLVGAIWQPSLVLADTSTLITLPERERRAAIGEMVKYGLLDGEDLLSQIATMAPAIVAGTGSDADTATLVRRCAAIKAWVVSRDEREQTGDRLMLNLGHTVGHAIETAVGYGNLLHGECVGLGLLASCRVSHRLGMCGHELEERTERALRGAGLATDIDKHLIPETLAWIGADKKRVGAVVQFVGLRGVGAPEVIRLELARLKELLLG